jgi:signal transduction histidine kinase
MERRAKRVKAGAAAKPPGARKARKSEGQRISDLEKRLGEALGQLETRNHELEEALERQTATSEILRVISRFQTDVQPVFDAIAARALDLCRATTGWVYKFDGELIHIAAAHSLRPEAVEVVRESYPMPPSRGGGSARAVLTRAIVYIPDIREDHEYRLGTLAEAADYLSVLAVPMLLEDQPIGVIVVTGAEAGAFSEAQIELLQTFADQAVIAVQNVRLFQEIEDKGRQLEAASRHKSEFLANMSHELRTPLNAIIGFFEVLSQRMFGDLNEKQEEYLNDICASGQHLLSLINDILDLSKIEAGRMELELTAFDLPMAIENALTWVRERAGRRGIALDQAVDQRMGQIRGDERKIKQVLLNLLSNALKFTPEGGRIGVRAELVDGMAEVSVADTGIGIAPEDQEAVFEEFRQVGMVAKKVEGTGLGLTLSRKFVELHGGRIWVKSEVGVGSTFTFTLPLSDEDS